MRLTTMQLVADLTGITYQFQLKQGRGRLPEELKNQIGKTDLFHVATLYLLRDMSEFDYLKAIIFKYEHIVVNDCLGILIPTSI